MDFPQNTRELLQAIGPGHMMSTAYDTAWLARLTAFDEPVGRQALDWLRDHQLPDGSWGAENPSYYHDRVICTLSAAIALARYGHQGDVPRLRRATEALETVVRRLSRQAMVETIGFEVVIPTLFDEAEALGIITRWEDDEMTRLNRQRTTKLGALPGGLINRWVTLAFSAELAGSDNQRLLDVERLQEANGSVGHSPSATAYFALQVRPQDAAAVHYLRGLANADGGSPDVAPFDIFERAWTLWNVGLVQPLDDELLALCQPHLDFLEAAWVPGKGAGFAAGYTPKDGDETSLVYSVLKQFERPVDIETVLSYEDQDYFRCYALEANASISTNIHVLDALRQGGLEPEHPSVRKIVRFLQSGQFWFDKWHTSPYYPTAHAIIACAGYVDDLVSGAVSWMLDTQNPDGSWGYFMPTAEETAYCLQALTIWRRNGYEVADDVLERAAVWLVDNIDTPYPPLWIGKCLYCPALVVHSAVLSALALVSQELGLAV